MLDPRIVNKVMENFDWKVIYFFTHGEINKQLADSFEVTSTRVTSTRAEY